MFCSDVKNLTRLGTLFIGKSEWTEVACRRSRRRLAIGVRRRPAQPGSGDARSGRRTLQREAFQRRASPARSCGVLTASNWRARRDFELPTPKFVVWCSIQLSYGRALNARAKSLEGRANATAGRLNAFRTPGKRNSRHASAQIRALAFASRRRYALGSRVRRPPHRPRQRAPRRSRFRARDARRPLGDQWRDRRAWGLGHPRRRAGRSQDHRLRRRCRRARPHRHARLRRGTRRRASRNHRQPQRRRGGGRRHDAGHAAGHVSARRRRGGGRVHPAPRSRRFPRCASFPRPP